MKILALYVLVSINFDTCKFIETTVTNIRHKYQEENRSEFIPAISYLTISLE